MSAIVVFWRETYNVMVRVLICISALWRSGRNSNACVQMWMSDCWKLWEVNINAIQRNISIVNKTCVCVYNWLIMPFAAVSMRWDCGCCMTLHMCIEVDEYCTNVKKRSPELCKQTTLDERCAQFAQYLENVHLLRCVERMLLFHISTCVSRAVCCML